MSLHGVPDVAVVPEAEVGATAGAMLLDGIRAVVAAKGRCRLAVPGGTGPVGVFRWLAGTLPADLAQALILTWVDERHAAAPADSNRQLAWDTWLSASAAPVREVPLDAPGTLAEAREAVAARFAAELGGIDVALLGCGPDGHIASLFPGHPALEEPGPVLAVPDSPKPPPERLTLSLPVLRDVELAVLVATGAAKAAVLKQALAGHADVPLGRYVPRGAWRWVLDPGAAG
ncbi:MAG: 6-phosphogluconolactonase [Myxococcota bacterium]